MTSAGGGAGLGGPRVGVATTERAGPEAYRDTAGLRALLREAMRQGGLGRADPARPLADVIRPGDAVLLKPNWVLHVNRGAGSMDCMVTHPGFILAALAEVVAAGAGRVILADAPVQSADFEALTPPSFRQSAAEVAGAVPCEFLDLRNTVAVRRGGRLEAVTDRRAPECFVLFDLAGDSLLEPISARPGQFRTTSYDPAEMARVQGPGRHQFMLCREPLAVDVVLNLPKLKMHAKAGMTAALKNLVGINGNKNYLPHHRVGGSAAGGDCYQGRKPFHRLAEWLLDQANARIGSPAYTVLSKAASLVRRVHGGNLDGRWHGNDTVWRMVLDLNRLLLYGRLDGTVADEPARRVYTLTDALVVGQGDGPLSPDDGWLGAVTFAESSAFADLVHTALMGLDWRRIPLVREAFGRWRWPLVDRPPEAVAVHHRDRILTLEETWRTLGRPMAPPDGWRGSVELTP